MAIYQLRNFRVRECVQTTKDEEGCTFKVYGSCDVTRTLAEKMDWEIVPSDGHVLDGLKNGKVKINGDLNLSSMSLIPNGDKKRFQIERLPASLVRDFGISQKGKEDDQEVRVDLVIVMPIQSADQMLKYHRNVVKGDAQLKLDVIGGAQMKLGDDEQPEEPATPPAKAQTLATAREMKQ